MSKLLASTVEFKFLFIYFLLDLEDSQPEGGRILFVMISGAIPVWLLGHIAY